MKGLNGWSISNGLSQPPDGGCESIGTAVDLYSPLIVNDDEELMRLSDMVERENLLRSMGVIEQVYRLLHGTAGTTGTTMQMAAKPHGQAHVSLGAQAGTNILGAQALSLAQRDGPGYDMASQVALFVGNKAFPQPPARLQHEQVAFPYSSTLFVL